MERSRIDSEQLIEAVKRQEYIWNKHKREYYKKNNKDTAWNNLCEEMVDDWESLNDEEKNFRQMEIKKRWNNIRDYYKKVMAYQMSDSNGRPVMKRKKYMFANKLEFLKPFYGKLSACEKSFNDDNSDNYNDDDNDNDNDPQEDEDPEFYELHYTSVSEESLPSSKQKTSPAKTEESPSKVQDETLEDECDMLFLKSLAPDMKMLNRRQKIDFKLGILQLYKQIMNDTQFNSVDPLDEESEKKFVL